MKLKPQGRILRRWWIIFILGIILVIFALKFNWETIGGYAMLAIIISFSRIFGITFDNETTKYDFNGRRQGADSLFEYEPGDKEYEKEKYWQEND